MIPVGAVLYDVTVPIQPGLTVWPGDPPVEVGPVSRIAAGDEANVSRFALPSHVGTHVDAPWHFVEEGVKLDEILLERWIGRCLVVEIPDDVDRIEPGHLEALALPLDVRKVLFKTRDSRRWENPLAPFATDYVGLSPEAARWVVERGLELVGIDYLSIAPYDDPDDAVHRTLLGAGVLIVEGLDLRVVPPGDYTMICLPLRVLAGDGAPARVLLVAGNAR